MKNVLGLTQFENICQILRNNKFSLCCDESTDVSSQKALSIVVRVAINMKIHDIFFGLYPVQNADAKSLYEIIVKAFKDNNIDYKSNLIGYAADGANNMTGKHNFSCIVIVGRLSQFICDEMCVPFICIMCFVCM